MSDTYRAGCRRSKSRCFAAALESFSRANSNCSIAESIERFKRVMSHAKADGIEVVVPDSERFECEGTSGDSE